MLYDIWLYAMASNKAIAAEGFLREFSIFSSPKRYARAKTQRFHVFSWSEFFDFRYFFFGGGFAVATVLSRFDAIFGGHGKLEHINISPVNLQLPIKSL